MKKLLAIIGMILIILSISGRTEGTARGFVPMAAAQFGLFGLSVSAGILPIRRNRFYYYLDIS